MFWVAPDRWILLLSAKDPRVLQQTNTLWDVEAEQKTHSESQSAKRQQLHGGKRHYLRSSEMERMC